MLWSLFLLLLCMCIFYIPLLRLNWGISSIKAITFLDEPSATNAMRDLAMPTSDITKDESLTPQLEISEPLSPSDNSVFITSVDFKDYIVARGDTVSGITQKFGLKNMGTLLSVNNINNAKSLTVGQKLSIPSTDGIIYTVIKGDSLGEIAAKFKLPLTAILDANDMESQTISLGQRLFIPGASISTFELRKALGELFIYPIAGRLTSPFGYRRDPFTGRKSFHTGIDIAAPTGTPIKLTLDGTVSYTGYSTIYGNYVIVTHSGGYQSMYGHMHTIKVKRGQILSQGSIIGTVGNTGRSTGPHVHFSVYKNGKLINPLTVLK
ncbi:M23 family metallopeptidase [Treponema denticola]|nr:M23 family metallopeptidase [Treponema denticola]